MMSFTSLVLQTVFKNPKQLLYRSRLKILGVGSGIFFLPFMPLQISTSGTTFWIKIKINVMNSNPNQKREKINLKMEMIRT
jgi:hypothetical protein